MVDAHQGRKLAAACYKLFSNLSSFSVVLERVCREAVDSLGSSEVINLEAHNSFPKNRTARVQVAGVNMEVSRTIPPLLLLTVVVEDASGGAGATAGTVNLSVRPEQKLQQIVRDFLSCAKLSEVLLNRGIGRLDVVYQDLEMFCSSSGRWISYYALVV